MSPPRIPPFRIPSSILRLSPAVWGVAFVALGLRFFPGVPVHWRWDSFSYCDAAMSGLDSVPLGFGRTLFCWLGRALDAARRLGGAADPFATFRLWIVSGLVVQGTALSWACVAFGRRWGVAAAHAGGAVFALNATQLHNFLAVFPESWATVVLVATMGVLASRCVGRRTKLVLVTVGAVLAVLLKEVSFMYLPGLGMLVASCWPGRMSLARRMALAVGWTMLAAGAAAGIYTLMFTTIPGLKEARAEWTSGHFGQAHVGLSAWQENAVALLRVELAAPATFALAALGAATVASAFRPARRRYLFVATGLVLLAAAPAALAVATGATRSVGRYSVVMVPGLAALAALGVSRVARRGGWPMPAIALLLATAVLGDRVYEKVRSGATYAELKNHRKAARKDAKRYAAMLGLRGERLAVVPVDDSQAAYFLSRHGGAAPCDWTIHWPTWNVTDPGLPEPGWVTRQLAGGRAVAISATATARSKLPMEEVLAKYAPHEFTRHPSGWWVARE